MKRNPKEKIHTDKGDHVEFAIGSPCPNEGLMIKANNTSPSTIQFWEDNKVIGTLDWSSGEFVFKGKAKQSALKLFEWFKQLVDPYLNEKAKRRF